MSWFLRCYRKFLASMVLGLWAFAVFVGIANACSLNDVAAAPHLPTVSVHAVSQSSDDGVAPGHEHSCSNDLPWVGVLMQAHEQPASQPLVLAELHHPGFPPTSAPALRFVRTGHPPPGVPLSLRTVRLAL